MSVASRDSRRARVTWALPVLACAFFVRPAHADGVEITLSGPLTIDVDGIGRRSGRLSPAFAQKAPRGDHEFSLLDRMISALSRFCAFHVLATAAAIAATLFVLPPVAFADVLEITASGPAWIAGGPASPVTPDDSVIPLSGPDVERPLVTHAAATAGPGRWQERIAQLSAKYDISPALLEAVVWQESRWNESAVSPAGARGLAQLMPGTARAMGVDPDDPHANLEGGARYLRMQLDAFGGDLEKALAAYNAGPGRVQQAGGVPAIRETRNYVASIMSRLSDPVRR